MEYYNKIICVTIEDLTRQDDGEAVMTLSNYKQLVARKRLNVIRQGRGLGGYVRIEYDSVPERFRERFVAKYGNPAEAMQEKCMGDAIKIDKAARDFFEAHLLPTGEHLPVEKIEEYTINASVLNELVEMLNDRAAMRKALGGNAMRVWETISGTVERFRDKPGHTLPTSLPRLKAKINEYRRESYECLISRKFGNENTLKITKEAGDQIIALKRSRVPVYTNEQIFHEFNRIAFERGWKCLKSINSLILYLNRPEIEPLWYDAVCGELAAKQRYGRKHKTKLPQMRDALWYSDGTKLNLYYKAYESNRLVVRTTQVYEVMDAFSEVLLGYHISDSEDFEAQYHAFRMAIESSGHKPYEIVNDNQGGHKKLTAIGFLDRITTKISRRTAPYNGNSKTIESAFGRFQAQILHRDWRFTGQNITTKSDKSRPNLEFIEANKENLYTLQELKAEYAKMREVWNVAKHPATGRPRIEMYRRSTNPETIPVDRLDMIEMFWILTDQPSTFTSAGITIQIKNKTYTYEVMDATGMPDMEFRRKHTNRPFRVKYDPQDMTQVRLYVETHSGLRYVADAQPYVEIHRAQQEQKPGEMAFIRQMEIVGKQERINRAISAAELEMVYGVAPEQHGLNRPRLKGLNATAVDSLMMGLHKPKRAPEPIDIGVVEKVISNRTFDEASIYDKL